MGLGRAVGLAAANKRWKLAGSSSGAYHPGQGSSEEELLKSVARFRRFDRAAGSSLPEVTSE